MRSWAGILTPTGLVATIAEESPPCAICGGPGHPIAANVARRDRPAWELAVWSTIVARRSRSIAVADLRGPAWSMALAPHPRGVCLAVRPGYLAAPPTFSGVADAAGVFLAAETSTPALDPAAMAGVAFPDTTHPDDVARVAAVVAAARDRPQVLDARGRSGIRWRGMVWRGRRGLLRIEAIGD